MRCRLQLFGRPLARDLALLLPWLINHLIPPVRFIKFKIAAFRLRGLLAATLTAFHPDGSVNYSIVPEHRTFNRIGFHWFSTMNQPIFRARPNLALFHRILTVSFEYALVKRLIKSGCSGAWVIGTTGEFSTLTVDERKKLAEAWVNAIKEIAPNFGLIVHIGAASIEDSKELARHAESIGAPAIAAIPPVFFKPENIPDLVSTMQQIAGAAPKTPFYYYRIPAFILTRFSIFTSYIPSFYLSDDRYSCTHKCLLAHVRFPLCCR